MPAAGSALSVQQTKRSLGWLPLTCFVLSVVALAASAYLTYAHYASTKVLACPGTGTINCEQVTTSAQSNVAGVPVALLGVLWSAATVALTTPAAWRSKRPEIRIARLALVSVGMCFVVWLLYAELFVIGAICLWCTLVHAVTFALFVLVMVDTASTRE